MRTLEVRNVGLAYGSHTVLESVSAVARAGHVTALLGGNGAGKTTLLKILSGSLRPQSGQLLIDGAPVSFHGVRDATWRGIRTVHQAHSLIGGWAVWEHFCEQENPWLTRDRSRAVSRAKSLLAKFDLDIDPDQRIALLTTAERQAVEIAKALSTEPQALLVDEPTAGLDSRARRWIYATLRDLAGRGKIVVIVSHDIPSMMQVADHVLFLRNGRVELSAATSEIKPEALGFGDLASLKRAATPASGARPADGRKRARLKSVLGDDVEFELAPGDVLGVTGHPGSGAEDFVRALVGLSRSPYRDAVLDGAGTHLPLWQLARRGILYVSRERETEWLFGEHSVARNVTAGHWPKAGPGSIILDSHENNQAASLVERFSIHTPSLAVAAGTLSGGNQQKTVLARAVGAAPKVLLLDEPFSGVDAPTRALIIDKMRSLAEAGTAIVLFTRECLEASVLATRWIYLLRAPGRPRFVDHPLTDREVTMAQDGLLQLSADGGYA